MDNNKTMEGCAPLDIGANVPEQFAVPLYGYAQPTVVAVTVVTNGFIMYVLSRRHLRTPTNVVLLAMAVAELFTGLSASPWMLYYYTLGGYVSEQEWGLPTFWCEYHRHFVVTLPSIFHNCVIFLNTYLAIQRYIYVCASHHVARYCTMAKTRLVIGLIGFIATAVVMPGTLTGYNRSVDVGGNTSGRVCLRCTRDWVCFLGPNAIFPTLYWFKAIFIHLLSCLLLIVLTAMLIRTLRQTDLTRRAHITKNHPLSLNLNPPGGCSAAQTPSTERTPMIGLQQRSIDHPSPPTPSPVRSLNSVTRMLVVVIVVFLLIEIPLTVIFLLHVLIVSTNLFQFPYHYINIAVVFRNMFVIITYPFNFAIYCGMSDQFRQTVRQMFDRRLPNDRKVTMMARVGGQWRSVTIVDPQPSTPTTPQTEHITRTMSSKHPCDAHRTVGSKRSYVITRPLIWSPAHMKLGARSSTRRPPLDRAVTLSPSATRCERPALSRSCRLRSDDDSKFLEE